MSSPKIEVFVIYDADGVPLTGVAPTFASYMDDTGTAITPPAISEIGGGAYRFTPTFTDTSKGIVYIINCGAGNQPTYYSRYIRNTDWDIDYIDTILQYNTGKWAIKTSGPDINKLIIYAADGVTELYKFSLLDKNGIPTTTNPYSRIPE